MATTRKTAATKTPAARTTRRKTTTVSHKKVDETTKQGMLEAYSALQQAGVPIPEELLVVEEWVAEIQAERAAEEARLAKEAAKREAELAEANKNGPWYVRNGYPAPFNLRLDRQIEKRRIELKPRGMPGDLHPLQEDDLKDPVLRTNLNLGLIEVIPAGEANLIIEKQMTNSSQRVHTPLALLRNATGEMYKQGAVKVEAEFNSQGITVAQLDPRTQTGELHDRDIKRDAGLTRTKPGEPIVTGGSVVDQATSVVSTFVPTGGNPASIQFGMNENAQAKIADDIARRKNIQGPAAGLNPGIQVVVEPTRRV